MKMQIKIQPLESINNKMSKKEGRRNFVSILPAVI